MKKAHFNQAITFIDQIKNKNGKILVHCKAGVSRSATICLAYLISNSKKCLNDAYDEIKSKRRVISPNFNFMGQLLSWQDEQLGTIVQNGTISQNGTIQNGCETEMTQVGETFASMRIDSAL